MSDQINVSSHTNVSLGFEPAGIGPRILAYLIDIAILTIGYLSVFGFMGIIIKEISSDFQELGIVLMMLFALPFMLYSFLFELFNNGQTPGKSALNIRVLTVDGQKPLAGSLLIRWIFRLIDIFLSSGVVALIAILVSEKQQRIGDIVANTMVVKTKRGQSISIQSLKVELPADYVPTYPQAKDLDYQEIALIKELISDLDNINRIPRYDLILKLRAQLSKKYNIPSEGYDVEVLKTLLKDHQYYAQNENG